MSEKINVLIVGSLGFIGSHTMKYFQMQMGFDCYGCDVMPGYGLQNYWQIDATNADFKSIFAQQRFDFCINCSGAASVPDSWKHPERDFFLNVNNVAKLLEAIRLEQPNCKFVQLSSAAVYGNPQSLPIKESAPLQPVSPYGYHKLMAEMLVKEYVCLFGINASILRLFSVYGPGLKKQLFWDWHQKAINGKDVEMWGTGNETRDFIEIEDLSKGIYCVLNNAAFDGEAYNVASGISCKIMDAATYFANHHTPKFKFRFNQIVRSGDPLYWQANIDKIKSIGFTPATKIADGIFKYLQWLEEEK
ncbi:NAD-dependent epimerase/dehydratase family protein [Hydrotalea sp.]|uniref:NAD-dependent epimerase/dehydratase family protein n=1 Tax=Hydrotalea sp. TaxID=2881279 RepID=UPI003D137801